MPDLIINETKSFNIDNIRVNNIIICLTEEDNPLIQLN